MQCIIVTTCLSISTTWYFESNCKMLHIMCILARICYILAGFKMVCEVPADGMVICQNKYE